MAAGISAECLAIILCESVVDDARTHNKSIQNTFNTIWAKSFPAEHDRFTVFVSLTGIHGRQDFKVRVAQITKDEPEGKPLLDLGGKIKSPDPWHVVDLTLDMRRILIPQAGDYEIRVCVAGDQVGVRRFMARTTEKRGGG